MILYRIEEYKGCGFGWEFYVSGTKEVMVFIFHELRIKHPARVFRIIEVKDE